VDSESPTEFFRLRETGLQSYLFGCKIRGLSWEFNDVLDTIRLIFFEPIGDPVGRYFLKVSYCESVPLLKFMVRGCSDW
jgi:hypothetical protein